MGGEFRGWMAEIVEYAAAQPQVPCYFIFGDSCIMEMTTTLNPWQELNASTQLESAATTISNNYFMPLYDTTARRTIFRPNKDFVRIWSKEVCINWSGPNRMQPKCVSPDGSTFVVSRMNEADEIFNNRLRSLLIMSFNSDLGDARFIHIDAYAIFQEL